MEQTSNTAQQFPRIESVRVHLLDPVNSATEKGKRTWSWLKESTDSSVQVIIGKRNKDELMGNHFHVPKPFKDPEQFILLSGSVLFTWKDAYGGILEKELHSTDGIYEVKTPAYIYHSVLPLTDQILFLEYQSLTSDLTNSHTYEEFPNLHILS